MTDKVVSEMSACGSKTTLKCGVSPDVEKASSTEAGVASEKGTENIGLVAAITGAEPLADFENQLGPRFKSERSTVDTET